MIKNHSAFEMLYFVIWENIIPNTHNIYNTPYAYVKPIRHINNLVKLFSKNKKFFEVV